MRSIAESPARNRVIFGALLVMFLAALEQYIVGVSAAEIARSLGAPEYIAWIVSIYLLMATSVTTIYGKLSDQYGRNSTVKCAVFLFLLGAVVCAFSGNIFLLLLGRAIQGLGGGGLYVLGQSVIGDWIPPAERPRYAMWISGTWAAAGLLGPVIGAVFVQHLHWSLIFWINVPVGLLALCILHKPLSELPLKLVARRPDYWGALLLVLATVALLFAINPATERIAGLPVDRTVLVLSSLLLYGLLIARMAMAANPILAPAILSNRIVLCASLAMFFFQACLTTLAVYLPVFIAMRFGVGPSAVGVMMLGLTMGSVVGAIASASLIPRIGHYKYIAVIGVGVALVGLACLSIFHTVVPLALFQLLSFAIGCGSGTILPVTTISTQNAAQRPSLGEATGLLFFLRSLGGALGIAGVGVIMQAGGLNSDIEPPGLLGQDTFLFLFLACAAMFLLACVCLILMPSKKLKEAA